MLLDDFWWGVGDFILSESGCPGFEDLQDVIGWFLWGVGDFLSESGCPGFEDLQDVIGWFLVGTWGFFRMFLNDCFWII